MLIGNKVSPILLVAFTNHALDHMLKGVLDAKITNNIIRLGSKHAADERIMEFSLDNVERMQANSKGDRMVKSAYREMKASETEMIALMNKLAFSDVPQDHLEKHLLLDYPIHHETLFTSPPDWIWGLVLQVAESQAGWTTVGESQQDLSILQFWLKGQDLVFLRPPGKKSKKKSRQERPQDLPNFNPFAVLSEQAQRGNGQNGKHFLIHLTLQRHLKRCL